MFTFGIFTTHFPYIAFVVFYAYFLIFGITKATAGEIESEEKYITTEWFSESYHGNSNVNSSNISAYQLELQKPNSQNQILKRKIIYPDYFYQGYQQNFICNSLFNRPPPMA